MATGGHYRLYKVLSKSGYTLRLTTKLPGEFVPEVAMGRDRSGEKGVSKMKFFFKDLRAEILGGNRLWSN